MKASILGGAAIAILILLGAGAYAVETKPPDKASDAEVATPQRKSPKNLMEKGEKLLKTAEKNWRNRRNRSRRPKSIKFSGRPDAPPRPGRS